MEFCPHCEKILELDKQDNVLFCPNCNFEKSNTKTSKPKTKKSVNDQKEFMHKLHTDAEQKEHEAWQIGCKGFGAKSRYPYREGKDNWQVD